MGVVIKWMVLKATRLDKIDLLAFLMPGQLELSSQESLLLNPHSIAPFVLPALEWLIAVCKGPETISDMWLLYFCYILLFSS